MRNKAVITEVLLLMACTALRVWGADAAKSPSAQIEASQTLEKNLGAVEVSADAALRYRRVLVPADRPEDWPKVSGEHYLPIPISEFNQRVSRIINSGKPTQDAVTPLARAIYSVRIDQDYLVDGRLNWDFEHHGTKAEIAVLGKCGFALSECKWLRTEKDATGAETAVVGNDDFGRLAAVVDRSGTIEGQWSMRGTRGADGSLEFNWCIPSCATSVLELKLTDGMKPTVDRGVVSAPVDAGDGTKIWRIELGGCDQLRLKIDRIAARAEHEAQIAVRETATYHFSGHGVELVTDFEFQQAREESRRVEILVDRRLTLAAVRLDELQLGAEADPETQTGEGNRRYFVELPPFSSDRRACLRVIATAPLAMDQVAALPVVRLEGPRWESGTACIEINPPCELGELWTKDCRAMVPESNAPVDDASKAQKKSGSDDDTGLSTGKSQHGTGGTPTDGLSRSFEFELFNDHPEIELSIIRPRQQMSIVQGTAVTLRANEGSATYKAKLTVDSGEMFNLEAEVAPQWIIESVESIPAGWIADWSRPRSADGAGNLRVLLNKPLARDCDLWLSVTARRQRAPWGSSFGANDLAMLRFPLARGNERRIVEVQTSEAFQLQLRDVGELERLDPTKLVTADGAVLPDTVGGMVFVANHAAQLMGVSLASRAAQFEADIQENVTVNDDSLVEAYRLAVAPNGREIGRFNVRFSQPRSIEMAWSIEGAAETTVAARRLSQAELKSTNLSGGEVWEVTLPGPTTAPIVLLGRRTAPLADEMPVALASIVEAEAQHGTVEIRSTGRTLPEVISRLKSVPGAAAGKNELTDAIADFRYSPEEDVLLSADPPLSIGVRPHGNKMAWIRNEQMETRFDQAATEQVLTCEIENSGRSQIQLSLPAGAVELRVSVNDQFVAAAANDSGKVTINLPPEERFDKVVMAWAEKESLGGILESRGPPWPGCDLPILNRTWVTWLPPGYRAIDARIGETHPAAASWAERLFWPFSQESVGGEPLPAHGSRIVSSKDLGKARRSDTTLTNSSLNANELPAASWTGLEFVGVGETESRIWITRSGSFSAWQWSLMLISIGGRWCFGKRKAIVDIAAIGFGASAVLLLPGYIAPLVGAAWMGLVVGCLMVRVWPTTKRSNEGMEQNDRTKVGVRELTTTIGATAIMLLVVCEVACGQKTEPSDGGEDLKPKKRVWQIFFPVNDQEKLIGDICYVPEQFWGEIERLDSQQAFTAPACLITRARYRMPLVENETRTATSGLLEADFDVISLANDAVVALPLGMDGASLLPDGMRLDGQPETFSADERRRRVKVELPKAASHRLEVLFRPTEINHTFDFAVPPVNRSDFDVRGGGTELAKLNLKTAVGAEQSAGETGIRLGPAERIVLGAKSDSAEGDATAAVFDVDQLDCLRVGLGSVKDVLTLQVDIRTGRLHKLQMKIDPRWELVSPTVPSAFKATQNRVSGAVTVQWGEPLVGKGTVELSFELGNASGIGKWEVPSTKVIGARDVRRWDAINIDAALAYELVGVPDEARVATEKLGATWPSVRPGIQAAWKVTENADPVEISTRPQTVGTTARYQLAVVAEAREVLLRLSASVKGDVKYAYTVDVPKSIEIERVAVIDQSGERSCQWSRGLDGKLSIVPEGAMRGVEKLLIIGRKVLTSDGNFTVPAMRIEHCSSAAFSVLIARRHDALLKINAVAEMAEVGEVDSEEAISDARADGMLEEGESPVAILQNARDFRPVSLHIERNAPQIQVEQITSMSRQAAGWSAQVDASLSIEHGVADELRFELPANWIGPFENSPIMGSSVEEVPGERRRQLTLTPETALSGRVELRIRGPLTLTPGQTPTAPDARLVDAVAESLYVLLPRQQENKQLSWDVRRLIPTRQLPERLSDLKLDLQSNLLYRMLGERSRASLRSAQRGSEKSRVRAMDVSVSWSHDNECAGTAAFDLESAGETSCELMMPERSELVSATIDGTSSQVTGLSEGHYSVWLGDNQFPRRLEVVFTSAVQPTNSGGQISVPCLVGLPAERTLWTVKGPSDAGVGKINGGPAISSAEMAIARLEQTVVLADSVTGLLVDEPVNDVERWYDRWNERYEAARASAESAMKTLSAKEEELNLKERMQKTEEIRSRLQSRLDGARGNDQDRSPIATVREGSRIGEEDGTILPISRRIASGGGASISINYSAMPGADRSRTIAGLFIGMATAAAIWFGKRRGSR